MLREIDRRDFLVTSSALALTTVASPGLAQTRGAGTTQQWNQWRGPNGNGTTDSKISDSLKKQNMKWATPIPGRGHASATVTDQFIYLPTADKTKQTQSVLALRRDNGQIEWTKQVSSGGLSHGNHPKNTEATPSVACDGERLFITFHHHDAVTLYALDLNGNVIYEKEMGPFVPKIYEYGYAPSPTIYKDFLIISSEYEKYCYLTAIDRETGKEVWRTERPLTLSFSSPIVGHVAGRDQILLSGGDQVAGYDPLTGKQLWGAAATTKATCGTLVWNEDSVFASGGYPKSETVCVAADGSGQVKWKNVQKCYEQSMLVIGDYVYAVNDGGIAYCWRASDGQTMWRHRFGGLFSSSPTLAGDVIHVFSEAGEHHAFRPNPNQMEVIASEKIASDVFASPSIVDGVMYLRVGNQEQNGTRQEYLAALT